MTNLSDLLLGIRISACSWQRGQPAAGQRARFFNTRHRVSATDITNTSDKLAITMRPFCHCINQATDSGKPTIRNFDCNSATFKRLREPMVTIKIRAAIDSTERKIGTISLLWDFICFASPFVLPIPESRPDFT
jgi:hypothetical protein